MKPEPALGKLSSERVAAMDRALPQRVPGEFRGLIDVQLGHDPRLVMIDGKAADPESAGYFYFGYALGQ